jgi:hypothetical protein
VVGYFFLTSLLSGRRWEQRQDSASAWLGKNSKRGFMHLSAESLINRHTQLEHLLKGRMTGEYSIQNQSKWPRVHGAQGAQAFFIQ